MTEPRPGRTDAANAARTQGADLKAADRLIGNGWAVFPPETANREALDHLTERAWATFPSKGAPVRLETLSAAYLTKLGWTLTPPPTNVSGDATGHLDGPEVAA